MRSVGAAGMLARLLSVYGNLLSRRGMGNRSWSLINAPSPLPLPLLYVTVASGKKERLIWVCKICNADFSTPTVTPCEDNNNWCMI